MMTSLEQLFAWAEGQTTVNQYGTKEYGPFVCHTMNLFDERSSFNRPHGYCCEWSPPYGFVPEAGCPEHDV